MKLLFKDHNKKIFINGTESKIPDEYAYNYIICSFNKERGMKEEYTLFKDYYGNVSIIKTDMNASYYIKADKTYEREIYLDMDCELEVVLKNNANSRYNDGIREEVYRGYKDGPALVKVIKHDVSGGF